MDLKKIKEKELVIRATLPSEKLLIKCLDKVGLLFFSLRIEMQSLILSTTFNDFKEKLMFKRRGKKPTKFCFQWIRIFQ